MREARRRALKCRGLVLAKCSALVDNIGEAFNDGYTCSGRDFGHATQAGYVVNSIMSRGLEDDCLPGLLLVMFGSGVWVGRVSKISRFVVFVV